MNEQPSPLFRYGPLADYEPPPWPATENVRRGVRAFWRSVRRHRPVAAPAVDPSTLSRLPDTRLEAVACHQRTEVLTAALVAALAPWAEGEVSKGSVRVVVSAAHCATRAALVGWAAARGWAVIEPPTAEQILGGGEAWLASLETVSGQDCVLPRLERCFLRHAEGLDLFRRLLAWLLARRGRCLVGCNSWAWAYLSAALGVDAVLAPPLTLAPLRGEALGRWFQELLSACSEPDLVFRNAASGRVVLSSADAARRGEDCVQAEKPDDFLTNLAAGSRGIAAVAWAIWRHSLRVSAAAETSDEAREKAGSDFGSTIWVKPWSDLNLPAPPPQARQSHRFISHALLIHGGLTEDAVDLLVPISGSVLRQSLRVLATEGLIEQAEGVWQVTHCAYPAVRQALVNEEYLAGVL